MTINDVLDDTKMVVDIHFQSNNNKCNVLLQGKAYKL